MTVSHRYTYIDVILPLPLKQIFTYRVPDLCSQEIKRGSRVVVNFGAKRFYTAIVYSIYKTECEKEDIKEIFAILDDKSIIDDTQLKLWEWISLYYMCSLGEVFKAAMPSAFRIASDTYVALRNDIDLDVDLIEGYSLSNEEAVIINSLADGKSYKINEIEKICKIKNSLKHIKILQDKGLVNIAETVQNDYREKVEEIICLPKTFDRNEADAILKSLSRSKEQQRTLQLLLEEESPISRKSFQNKYNVAASTIKKLIEKEIISLEKRAVSRRIYQSSNCEGINLLSEQQETARQEITDSFKQYDISLLYGITGSGKTEVYIHLIKEYLEKGKQVLYLVPEIALTTQITMRLEKIFGSELAVYHSRLNDNERADIWLQLQNGKCKIVLGTRSSVFLPFQDLGLIVIDEEHETSFKQQDPSPRYNAKNTAMMLAFMHSAKVLLGSATPSIESYSYALKKKYGLIRLDARYSDSTLPAIYVEGIKEYKRKKQMHSIFSPKLYCSIQKAISENRQVILFQNRRGYAPYIECGVCGWSPSCNQCDVSLTYHKYSNALNCHYCGNVYNVPAACPNCESIDIEAKGFGTERVEIEVTEQFPDARVSRMDLDTTKGKQSFRRILSDFENAKNNVLVGTQMVAKGLDFDRVDVVGVMNASSLLNYPNFRAHERAFQLLTQVSGRAGRKNKSGKVYLQTTQPDHPVIECVKAHDYESFFNIQIEERALFKYPPFCRLIEIVIKAKDKNLTDEAAEKFANLLRPIFGKRILGPSQPPIPRVQLSYIKTIMLKIENTANIAGVRNCLLENEKLLFANKEGIHEKRYSSVSIFYNVDPV